MATTASLAILVLQLAGAGLPPPVPAFGLTVVPKSQEILALERKDPVARRCARWGQVLAAKVRGEVGDVSIQKAPGTGTVWRATLLMAKEPPLAPRMTCDARTFTIANDSYDVSTPPENVPWPYCGWGLAKADRAGLRCEP